MLSFRNEYCFFFFLRHIFICGHLNAVLPSETCRTKTGAEGLESMENQRQLLPQISELLVFNCQSRKERAISALQDKVTVSYHHDFGGCCHEEIRFSA